MFGPQAANLEFIGPLINIDKLTNPDAIMTQTGSTNLAKISYMTSVTYIIVSSNSHTKLAKHMF
jgi:hypothetical protein